MGLSTALHCALASLRGRAREHATTLTGRLPAAGIFGLFLEQHGRADQVRFGREAECAMGLGRPGLMACSSVTEEHEEPPQRLFDLACGFRGHLRPCDRSRKLTRIVDTLHFAPSSASRLVQAADVIAFLYRRVFTVQETDERSRKAKIATWSRLVPRIHHELCWFRPG